MIKRILIVLMTGGLALGALTASADVIPLGAQTNEENTRNATVDSKGFDFQGRGQEYESTTGTLIYGNSSELKFGSKSGKAQSKRYNKNQKPIVFHIHSSQDAEVHVIDK